MFAVFGDPKDKAIVMVESAKLSIPVGQSLSIQQMKKLGLYISNTSSQKETDRPFPELGVFAVNNKRKSLFDRYFQYPFNRSDLGELLKTIEWIKENDYPNRGTYK